MMREAAILDIRAFSGFYGTIAKMFIHLLTHHFYEPANYWLFFFFNTDTRTHVFPLIWF